MYVRVRGQEMPPEDVEERPTEEEMAQLATWIHAGAPTARPEPLEVDPSEYLTEEERKFWSFQPPRRPSAPDVRGVDRLRSPIDRFLLARLEAAGLSFAEDADRQTQAMDLSSETDETRRLYGLDDPATADYGTRCLIARRLIERDVRFVQVFTQNQFWDHHGGIRKKRSNLQTQRPRAGVGGAG